MKSAVILDTHTVTDIQFQSASLDIWDAKYRLTAKDGSKIDEYLGVPVNILDQTVMPIV